jgi:ribosomal protein S18 acetylase RimI-like enzyme
MKIRTLTIRDYDAMVQLWTRAGLPFKPKGRDSRQMIEKQIEAFPGLFIGAFHHGKLAGLVIGSDDVRMKGWINRLAVDPRYRRQGIAQKLVEKVEEALERRGAAIFGALIDTPNEESLRLFEKIGYSTHPDILYVSKRRSEDV